MSHDIFISYSSKDKVIAEAVLMAFETNGLRCWVAPRDIKPGADWGDSIIEAINACKIVLLIFSGNANQSKHVRDEVYYAISEEKIILPFRIENLDPTGAMRLHLSSLHWLDAYQPSWQSHIDRLINSAADSLGRTLTPPNVQEASPLAQEVRQTPVNAPVIPPVKKEGKKVPWLWIGLAVVVTAGLSVGGMLWLGGRSDREEVQPTEVSSLTTSSTDVPTEAVVLSTTTTVPEDAILDPRNGHSYLFVSEDRSWHDARDYCIDIGGYLATAQDAAENVFIYSFGGGWLGATDEVAEGTWAWVSGESWDYTNWSGYNPDNSNGEHYLGFVAEYPFQWNDVPAENSMPFVCEWEPFDPDTAQGNMIVVTSIEDSGEGTLRQALLDAQAGNTITFDPTVFSLEREDAIFLQSGLPAIRQGFLTLDARDTRVVLEGSQVSGYWTPGLQILSDYNVINGFVIGGFSGPGILLDLNSQFNLIGGTKIGGVKPWGEGNLIVHNSDGIAIQGANNNIIAGNIIGTNDTATADLGNRAPGILLQENASGNVIGPDNLIAFNGPEGGAGIEIRSLDANANVITANSIHNNQDIGIRYNIEGFTPSQLDYLTPPVITIFDLDDGIVQGTTCVGCIVEIFSTDAEDGKIYEGTAWTDEYGAFYFQKDTALFGPYLTATSRFPGENTSEFSLPTATRSDIQIALEAIQNEAPFYQTSFDTRDFDEPEQNARIEDGKLIITSEYEYAGVKLSDLSSDRFAVEFEFLILNAGPGGHCGFGTSNEDGENSEPIRSISASFSENGMAELAHTVPPDKTEGLAESSFDETITNTVTLLILGNQISTFINGQFAYTALDPDGNAVYTNQGLMGSYTIVCVYDNYKVWDLSGLDFSP